MLVGEPRDKSCLWQPSRAPHSSVPPAGGEGALLPDPQESHRVALTILLAADVDAGAPPRR